MRVGYSSVGGGSNFSSYSLTKEDLEEIIAQHFGFDPQTINVSGLDTLPDEIHVSGSRPTFDRDEDVALAPGR